MRLNTTIERVEFGNLDALDFSDNSAFDKEAIEVVRAESGQPALVLRGKASALADERGVTRWHLSLSHSGLVAEAIAVASA